MRPPQAIFFDFDGVILESLDVKTQAMARLFADRPAHSDAIVRYHLDNAGVSRYEKFRHFYREFFKEPLDEQKMAELDRRFGELIWEEMGRVGFVPGAKETLERWGSRVPCFVVSASPQAELERIIAERGLARFFRSAHGSPKSKKEHLNRLLEENRLGAADCVFIGDGKADWEAARAVGMPFVQRLTSYSPTPFGADVIAALPDLHGLNSLLGPEGKTRVTIAHVRGLSSLRPPDDGSRTWVYLGGDHAGLRGAERRLGSGWKRTDISAELQAAARALRRPYLEWVEELNRRNGKDPDWWMTQFAEKNPAADPFFTNACRLEVLRGLANGGGLPRLIVCEDGALLRAAAETASRARDAEIETCGPLFDLSERLADWARLAARSISLSADAAACLLSRRGPGESRRRSTAKPLALIATYLHESETRNEGPFHDRYMPGLKERLEERGYDVWILPTAFGFASRLAALRRFRGLRGLLIPEDWLTVSDHAAALVGCWRSLRLPGRIPDLRGLPVGFLAAAARRRQARSSEGFQARLVLRLIPRLAAAGFRPELVVSWYENHKTEKALALAVRRSLPEAEHVGYYSMAPLDNYLSPVPLPTEAEFGALPRRLACCGREQAALLGAYGKSVPIETAGALRYRHVWEERRSITDGNRDVVLLALPHQLDEAADLVRTAGAAARTLAGVRSWKVKLHPDFTFEQLSAHLDGAPWPSNFARTDEPLGELLDQAAAVVSGGTSGTIIEAACRGIPILYVGSRLGLDYDPLESFPGLRTTCRTPEEVIRALARALSLGDEARRELARLGVELRGRCFEPVTAETLRPLLGSSGPAARPERTRAL